MDDDPIVLIVIYTQSSRYGFGEPLRVLYKAPKSIAMQVCSDNHTHGKTWFLGWTRPGHETNYKWERDDGRFDNVLRELGLWKEMIDGETFLVNDEC